MGSCESNISPTYHASFLAGNTSLSQTVLTSLTGYVESFKVRLFVQLSVPNGNIYKEIICIAAQWVLRSLHIFIPYVESNRQRRCVPNLHARQSVPAGVLLSFIRFLAFCYFILGQCLLSYNNISLVSFLKSAENQRPFQKWIEQKWTRYEWTRVQFSCRLPIQIDIHRFLRNRVTHRKIGIYRRHSSNYVLEQVQYQIYKVRALRFDNIRRYSRTV